MKNYKINLFNQNLTGLTEDNLISLCQLNNIEIDKLIELNLNFNNLINMDFITENTPFINLKTLWLNNNYELLNINNIRYLNNLEYLNIDDLKLNNEKETIDILKNMKKLKKLWCYDTFKNYNIKELQKELSNIKKINV